MKAKHFFSLTVIAALMLAACSNPSKNSPQQQQDQSDSTGVSRLHVSGTALVNESNDTVVLTGPSFGWHSKWGRFYNAGTVKALKEKWGANITRAAIGAHDSGDCLVNYDQDSLKALNLAGAVIDAAIDNDMYVICDWHSHDNTLANAKSFFTAITDKYGDSPNIIYEIWNEPQDVPWQEVKAYAEELIPVIRAKAPNAVIIVGTPKWDQDVDIAAEAPVDMPNLLYALHYYAASHKDWNRDKARKAIDAGLPLIISECGSMSHTGDGAIDYESWRDWIAFADENKLSVLMWDLADKNETCSMLTPDAPDNGSEWTDAHLREWARLAMKTTQERNARFATK